MLSHHLLHSRASELEASLRLAVISFGEAEGSRGFLSSLPSLKNGLLFFIELKLVLLEQALLLSFETFQQLLLLRSQNLNLSCRRNKETG